MNESFTKRIQYKIFLLLFAAMFISCSYHPYIPVGEIVDIDSPSTLNKNKIAITGAYGVVCQVLDYDVINGWIKANYGLTDKIELGIGGFEICYPDTYSTYIKYKHYSLGTFISSKFSYIPRILALNAGVGFGNSDLGNYANLTCGVILGYENRYIVPISQLNAYLGFPINPRTYDLSTTSDQIGEYMYTPSITRGIICRWGVKLPVGLWLRLHTNFNIYVICGGASVADDTNNSSFFLLGLKAEYQFK